MKRRFLAGLAIMALSGIASAASADPVTIVRLPTVGQKYTFDVSGKLTVSGMDVDISSKEADTITAVAADGNYTTESLQTDMQINGMPSPQAPASPTTSVNKADGELVSLTGGSEPETQTKLAMLTQFYYPLKPVSVGDSWSFEGKKDEKMGNVSFKADMKYLGEEVVGSIKAYKVQEDVKETASTMPVTLHSTVWLDEKDGSMVKVVSNFTDLTVPGGFTVSGSMTYSRS
jgi:hypothetical protein